MTTTIEGFLKEMLFLDRRVGESLSSKQIPDSGSKEVGTLLTSLAEDVTLSEQPSKVELACFPESQIDFNFSLNDLADSVTAVVTTALKLRTGVPDDEEHHLIKSHLKTIQIEMQIFTKRLETLMDFASSSNLGKENWIKTECSRILESLKQVDEKSNMFRLYLKDVVGPKGNLHKHKLLFASQYLIEAAVNLLTSLEKAHAASLNQAAVRVAVVAQRLFDLSLQKTKTKPTTSKMTKLFTDCLVSLTNAAWKRALQLPDADARRQIDEACANVGACARVFIDGAVPNHDMLTATHTSSDGDTERPRRPSSSNSSSQRRRRQAATLRIHSMIYPSAPHLAPANSDTQSTLERRKQSVDRHRDRSRRASADVILSPRSAEPDSDGLIIDESVAQALAATSSNGRGSRRRRDRASSGGTASTTSAAEDSDTSPRRNRPSSGNSSNSTRSKSGSLRQHRRRTLQRPSKLRLAVDSDGASSSVQQVAPQRAFDLLVESASRLATLLAVTDDVPAPGPGLASEVDRARKYLFRTVDAHLVPPDTNADRHAKRLAILLKRLVVDFESLKIDVGGEGATPGDSVALTSAAAETNRLATRVVSIRSLSKVVREMTQRVSSLLRTAPHAPLVTQARVFLALVRRYLLRVQLACVAQVAGSPIQVHLPLPLMLRGLVGTIALLMRALDDVGVLHHSSSSKKKSSSGGGASSSSAVNLSTSRKSRRRPSTEGDNDSTGSSRQNSLKNLRSLRSSPNRRPTEQSSGSTNSTPSGSLKKQRPTEGIRRLERLPLETVTAEALRAPVPANVHRAKRRSVTLRF